MSLIYAIAIGLSIAATAIVARRIGQGSSQRAAQAAGQILLIGLAVSLGIGVALGSCAPQVLRMLGASNSTVALGSEFARVMFSCNVTAFLIFVVNATFRGAGDAVFAMRTLWLANGVNIVLAPCLIHGYGPFSEMGVTGAAWSTNISRALGVLYQLWCLVGSRSGMRLRLHHLKPVPSEIRSIVTVASNGAAQLIIGTASWVLLIKIVAPFGSAAIAGYTIAIRVIAFVLTPALGFANAAATLVGQNLGAGKPHVAARAVSIAARLNVMFMSFMAAVIILCARPIVDWFSSDPQVTEFGVSALQIAGVALPLYAAGACFAAAFNGAGDTWTPSRMNLVCFWITRLPLAWFLAHSVGLGPVGVFVSLPVSFAVLTAWSAVAFRHGRWQHHSV
jgi:putative MATE family efflux protein